MPQAYSVAIVGVSSLVGEALVDMLPNSDLPVTEVSLLDRAEADASRVEYAGKQTRVQALEDYDFRDCDLAFFCLADAHDWVEQATACGTLVIDALGLYGEDEDVPLVVPRVNEHCLADYGTRMIVSLPQPETIMLTRVLAPVVAEAGLSKVVVNLLQSVSAMGKAGVEALAGQTVRLLSGQSVEPSVLPDQLAFSMLPQEADTRWHEEVRRVLELPDLAMLAHRVSVPVFFGHCELIHMETKNHMSAGQLEQLLTQASGIQVGDASPLNAAADPSQALISNIAEDAFSGQGLSLWMAADNIKWATAGHAIDNAICLIKRYL